jgi:hypothetical protein
MVRNVSLFCFAALLFSALGAQCAELFRAQFDDGLKGWKISNHENRVSFAVRVFEGEKALVVERSELSTPGDTAWELLGPKFPVVAGERVRVSVRSRGRGDARLAQPLGFGEKYRAAVIWFDSNGKPLLEWLSYGFEASPVEWRTRNYSSIVPRGAVSAALSIGIDNPDIRQGDVLAVSKVVVEHDLAPVKALHTTSLRDDGVVLYDGKAFFPIVLYGLKACAANGGSIAKAMDDARQAGFNTVQTYFDGTSEKLKSFLDLADERGLKAFVRPQPRIDGPTCFPLEVAPNRNRPSVLGWYLADDASGHHSPDQLEYRQRLVRSVDPDHLTLQSDTPLANGMNRYERYVHGTDVFLPQVYRFGRPLSDSDGVAYAVRDILSAMSAIKSAGSPVKSVWPILQHFKGWGWARFPTYMELRATVYQSIVHGARGIAFYTYCGANEKNEGLASSPERWAEAAAVVRELVALEQDLVSRDAPRQPTVKIVSGPKVDALGQPSVSVRLKTGPQPLLIVVSSVNERVVVKYNLKCEAKEVFSGRIVENREGFVDSLAPLGVNVYRLKTL